MQEYVVRVICAALLGASCIYGLVTCQEDAFVIVGVTLYLVDAVLIVLSEVTSNSDVVGFEGHAYVVSMIAGLDFLVTAVCLDQGVDMKLAALNLVPPLVDIVMKYLMKDNWNLVTPVTHVMSIFILLFFALRAPQYILLLAAVAFLVSQFGDDTRKHGKHLMAGLGVFAVVLAINGYDFKDVISEVS